MPIDDTKMSAHDQVAHQLQPLLYQRMARHRMNYPLPQFFEVLGAALDVDEGQTVKQIESQFTTRITRFVQTYQIAIPDAKLPKMQTLNEQLVEAMTAHFSALMREVTFFHTLDYLADVREQCHIIVHNKCVALRQFGDWFMQYAQLVKDWVQQVLILMKQ